KIKGGQKEKETLERITRLLQVKKLMFEVEALQKEKNLAGFEFPRETHLLADLKQPEEVRDKSTEKVSYVMRLKYSLLGGAIFFLLTALVFALSKLQETTAAGTLIFILRDLSFAAACALLASLIPLGTLRTSLVYGLTMGPLEHHREREKSDHGREDVCDTPGEEQIGRGGGGFDE